MPEQDKTLYIYSPLTADFYADGHLWEREILEGDELVPYTESIRAVVDNELPPGQRELNLMDYYDSYNSVKDKVVSAVPSVTIWEGALTGVTKLSRMISTWRSSMSSATIYPGNIVTGGEKALSNILSG